MDHSSESGQSLIETLIIILIIASTLLLFLDFEVNATEVIKNGFHTKN